MSKIDYDDPEVKAVAKVKCLKSLEFHTKYFFMQQYNRKFVVGDHHKIIWSALERVLKGELKRLIINIAPRYSKTEIAVKNFISNGLALNPSAKFIHLSYSDQLALDNSESVKDLIQTKGYQDLFPAVQIKKDSKAKDKWYTTKGGGVLARSASGQVTGFGAGKVDDEDLEEFLQSIHQSGDDLQKKMLFGGAIIIDDPIKPEDADQDTIREKVNSRYDSTIRNRVNSRDTPIIVIMQRLHPMDLAGYLQREGEADDWEVIELPTLIDVTQEVDDADELDEEGENKYVVIEEQESEESKEKTKKVYRALWPFKHKVKELLLIRKANELVFDRQYMQDPAPKHGLMFPLQDLKKYDFRTLREQLEDPDFVYLPVDPANEGGDDFSGIVCKLIGDKIYITDVLYNTLGADHNEEEVARLALEHRAGRVGVEGIMGWLETAKKIRNTLQERGFQGEFKILTPRTGKHSRIHNRASFIKNNIYFRQDYQDFPQYYKFMRNLTSYLKIQAPGQMNKHDDAPDNCEMAAAFFQKNYPNLWPIK